MGRWLALIVCVGCVVGAAGQEDEPAAAVKAPVAIRYIEREFMLPTATSGHGVDVLEVRADGPGQHPLAVLTHGTSAEPKERLQVTPWAQLGQALWFARRGYVAIVVVRDGYGRSGGVQDGSGRGGGCSGGQGSFEEAGENSARQLREVIAFMVKQPEVDGTRIVSTGVSTGGFAQVALSADPPQGLKAVINFAGGRGGDGKGNNCNLDGVISAYKAYGKKSRIPSLWFYAENDKWFTPVMAAQFDKAFKAGGGMNDFVMVGPDGEDGHGYYRHVSAWSDKMEAFLSAHDMLPVATVLPPPAVPDVPAPAGLSDSGKRAFAAFLGGGPEKAFATNGAAGWGSAVGMFDQNLADTRAVENCAKATKGVGKCAVVNRGK